MSLFFQGREIFTAVYERRQDATYQGTTSRTAGTLCEKDKLYQQYSSAKSQQKELEVIMKNVDMLIGKDNSQERETQKTFGRME